VDDQVTSQASRALALVAGLAILKGVVVALLVALVAPVWVGVLLGLAVAVGIAAGAWWGATPLALSLGRAEPADATAHARLHNLVEGLCVAGGVPKPALGVVPDPGLNAFVVGRSPDSATLAVTAGLLEGLSRVELEAVLAHELSHLRRGDLRGATLAVAVPGLPVALADRWVQRGSALAPLGRGVLAVVTPVVVPLLRLVVAERRDALADLAAIEATRYPPGLVSALVKMDERSTVVASPSRAAAHLWLAPPLPVAGDDPMVATNRRYTTQIPLDERIAALEEL
jgi:heat shock protein HtpX